MPIQFACSCGTMLRVAEKHAGKMVACPQCKTHCNVPPALEIDAGAEPVSLAVQDPPDNVVVAREITPPPLPVHDPWAEDNEIAAAAEDCEVFHRGPDTSAADFFVDAPREIGKLRSAHTSLPKATQPKPLLLRLGIGVAIGVTIAAVVALALGVFQKLPVDGCVLVFAFLSTIVTPVVVLLVLYFTRFRYFCAYVGDRGVAFFRCAGSRERLNASEMFHFDDADDLRVTTTRHYVNGAYTGTNYDYAWTDESGKRAYSISGSYNAEKTLPARHDKFHFALVAENAWSFYLLAAILPAIRDGEVYRFRLKGKNGLDVHKDFLELHLKGNVQRFSASDLAEVRVKEGVIALKEPGAREGWFTSSGVHYFSFADLANAQVFLMLMEHLYGVEIRDT